MYVKQHHRITMATATENASEMNKQVYARTYANENLTANRSTERKMSNKAKSIVVNSVIAPYLTEENFIAEFLSGRGQDIMKWSKVFDLTNTWQQEIEGLQGKNRIKWIGLDFSENGIEICRERIEECGLQDYFKTYQFDVLENKLGEKLPMALQNRKSIASLSLGPQYGFESKDKFDTLCENIKRANPALIFFTYPSPQVIKSGRNKFFKLDKPDRLIAQITNLEINPDSPYNNKYQYYQNSTCVNSKIQEYLVDEPTLFGAFPGYSVVFNKNHREILPEDIPEWSTVGLYKSVVLVKDSEEVEEEFEEGFEKLNVKDTE